MAELNPEMVAEMVEQELLRGEEAGLRLYQQFFDGVITQAEFDARLQLAKGYGVWWGSESSWGLKDVTVNDIRPLEDGSYEVCATCSLVYVSSHITAPHDRPLVSTAEVRMKVREDATVEEFHFQWR